MGRGWASRGKAAALARAWEPTGSPRPVAGPRGRGALRCAASWQPEPLVTARAALARRSAWTSKLIPAKDHASVQLNIGHLDEAGVYTGEFSTIALAGKVRVQGMADSAVDHLWRKMSAQVRAAAGEGPSAWLSVSGRRSVPMLHCDCVPAPAWCAPHESHRAPHTHAGGPVVRPPDPPVSSLGGPHPDGRGPTPVVHLHPLAWPRLAPLARALARGGGFEKPQMTSWLF